MSETRRFFISEVCEQLGIEQHFIVHCIRAHWIHPLSPETMELDEEDMARLQLIRELKEVFGANEDAIPIILHLLDQVYALNRQIHSVRKYVEESKNQKSA